MYGYGAWMMWLLSSVATSFAANPLMVKFAGRVGYGGNTGEAVGLGLAILFGFGLQWSITIAERPVLRFHLSPLVLFALIADFVTNWLGVASFLPLVADSLGSTGGLVQTLATVALTLGPEIFWALGRRSAEKGF